MAAGSEDAVEYPSGRLVEVVRLASALSDQVLDAQIMRRPIPPEQIAALARAARLLRDHSVAWPPLMEQVLHEFADSLETEECVPAAVESSNAGDEVVSGLTRFLGAFRRERSEEL